MKKLLISIFSFAFVACAAISAGAFGTPAVDASAEETSAIFTETKCQISNDGERMIMVTGIKDVSVVYGLGYEINGSEYVAVEGDTAQTDTYYESLTLGSVTKTAGEFIEGAEGLLVWEIAYDETVAYSVQAYAYVGEVTDNGQLIAPDQNPKTYGIAKENFNVFEVKFVNEEGEEIASKAVNYGATVAAVTAPEVANAEFAGWYYNGVAFNFDQKITGNITLTAKYNRPVTYSVKVMSAQYSAVYRSGYYYANTLSYIDTTSEYASYLNIATDGVAQAMPGTTIDITASLNNLPAGVKVSEDSILRGTVEEETPLELVVRLDFDSEYLGFDISQVCVGQYGAFDAGTFTLALKNGVVGLAVDGNINNGSALIIDIEDVDTTVTPGLVLNYYEQSATYTYISVADETGTYIAEDNTMYLLTGAPSEGVYYGTTVDLVDKFPNVNKITAVRMKTLTSEVKNMFVTGLKAINYETAPKAEVYSVDNGNLAEMVTPLAMGTMSQKSYHWATLGYAKQTVAYNFNGNTPGNQYYRIGVNLNLGRAIKVSDYSAINLLFQTTSQKQSDDSLNSGTVIYINGIASPETYYNGSRIVNLIDLAKAKGIETIKTVVIAHADWADRKNVNIYVGYVEMRTAVKSVSGTYSVDAGNLTTKVTALAGDMNTESKTFNLADGTSFTQNAVAVKYHNPNKVSGAHTSGLVIDFGETIFVGDYASIKIAFVSETDCGGNTLIFFNDKALEIASYASTGTAQVVDLIQVANAKKVTSFSEIELSLSSWANVRNLDMFVAYVTFELA